MKRPLPAHIGIDPPRDLIGEQVYAEEWRKLMLGPKIEMMSGESFTPFQCYTGLRPTLRRTRVAATLVCWLGTNCGISIVIQARRLKQAGFRDGMTGAWHMHNKRIGYVNHGIRHVEFLLTPSADRNASPWDFPLKRFPAISTDDLETIDAVLGWMDDDGWEFIQRCEREVRIRQLARSGVV